MQLTGHSHVVLRVLFVSVLCCLFLVLFFFQAEDGIRDVAVTGVQTCALPISRDGLKTVMSFAIITLPANHLMAEIHNDKQRMPALLRVEQQQAWLNADNDTALQCVEQYADENMLATAITMYINNPNNNDEACVKPAG